MYCLAYSVRYVLLLTFVFETSNFIHCSAKFRAYLIVLPTIL